MLYPLGLLLDGSGMVLIAPVRRLSLAVADATLYIDRKIARDFADAPVSANAMSKNL